MQERAGWFPGHPCVAVRSSRHHAFKESEDATHSRQLVQRGNDMHFGGAWIREAGFDPSDGQRSNQTLCSVHCLRPLGIQSANFAVKNMTRIFKMGFNLQELLHL